jgi:DNA-binding response OmpR family regulator
MRSRRKILVVMEQGAIRRLLAEALSLGGYEVKVTGEGSEDPRLPDGERPSLVLYDVSMPATLGRETLRRIREWDEEARIVAFSDPATAEMARQARDLGAREYVGDPFDLSTLLRVIADHARRAPRPMRTSQHGRGGGASAPGRTPAAASIFGGLDARG